MYFAVRSFPGYGKLSHRNVDDLVSGARVEPGEQKRDPLDFALWKASSDAEWGWESPWGRGRPGWHIECSAMAAKTLSPHFDVHCGGMDLIFPHHENEIAQSEAAWGEPFSRFWVHSGFLNVDAEKMSKSLGNFVTIAQILERNDGEALRYFFLGAHYHGPIEFDLEKLGDGRVVFPGLDEAERRVEYLYTTREALVSAGALAAPGSPPSGAQATLLLEAPERVLCALDNDLNTVRGSERPGRGGARRQRGRPGDGASARRTRRPRRELAALAAAAVESLDACCRPLGLMQAPAERVRRRGRASRRLKLRGLDAAFVDAKVQRARRRSRGQGLRARRRDPRRARRARHRAQGHPGRRRHDLAREDLGAVLELRTAPQSPEGRLVRRATFGFFDLRQRDGQRVLCAVERLTVGLPLGLGAIGPRSLARELVGLLGQSSLEVIAHPRAVGDERLEARHLRRVGRVVGPLRLPQRFELAAHPGEVDLDLRELVVRFTQLAR